MADRSGARAPLIDSEAMVGEWDPDAGGWWARDWVAGPAGTVASVLPGDVEIEIDVASPGTFVGLWVDDAGGGRPTDHAVGTLRTLIGDRRTADLLRTSPAGVRQLPGDELARRPQPQYSARPAVTSALATLVLAMHQAALDTSDMARALDRLDAAAAAVELLELSGPVLDLDTIARTSAASAVTVVLDHGHDLDPVDYVLLADRLRTVLPVLDDDTGRRARQLADELDRRTGEERHVSHDMASPTEAARATAPMMAPAVAKVAPAAAKVAPVSRLVDVDVSTLAVSYGVTTAAARATTSSEVEVRLAGRGDLAGRLWARAYDPAGAVLAVSRLVEAGDASIARLLIPPRHLPIATVDLTDRPADPVPSSTRRSVQAAIAHGRSAARADRLDDTKNSLTRWRRSEEAWRVVGDDDRADTARRFAVGPDRNRRAGPPLLSDRVIG